MRRATRLTAAALLLLALGAARAGAAPSFSTKDAGIRLSSAVAQGVTGSYPTLRLYYVRGSSQIVSATTADGLTFTDDNGVRVSSFTQPALDIAISSITGMSILPLTPTGFRMAYSVIGSTGSFRIYTATSANGIDWANDTGTALSGAQFPSLVQLSAGVWRMYCVSGGSIFTSSSTNQGRNWSAPALALAPALPAGAVSATQRTDGLVRLYFSAPTAVGVSTNTQILSALSTTSSGDAFTVEPGVRLSTGTGIGAVDFPLVVRSTDNFRWRVYYDFTPFPRVQPSTADVYSAVTDTPDVQSISPASWLNTAPPVSLTINGEVFSAAPTAQLAMGGQAPINGAVTRVNDQQLQVTFNTTGQATGRWNVTVADGNGQAATLLNSFLLDFPGGNVTMVDNLIRPRNGTKTQMKITVFNPGQLTVKLYTLDGRPLATLFDGPVTTGSQTVLWDGRTAAGHLVASGVYLVRAVGPKLDAINKIVVIK